MYDIPSREDVGKCVLDAATVLDHGSTRPWSPRARPGANAGPLPEATPASIGLRQDVPRRSR